MSQAITLMVNGDEYKVDVDPSWPLAYVLREELGLTGTKIACGKGTCGSCTVVIDGKAVFSCLQLVMDCDGKDILTIEGLADGDRFHPIQRAFIDRHGFQCGYCTPGMIMATKALLDSNPNPTEPQTREAIAGHLCRCGSYPKIIESIQQAAKSERG